MNNNDIYIIGHQNPDTDSIVSAVSYAILKNKIDPEKIYLPKRCGKINAETGFILNYFNYEAPEFIEDVKIKAIDLIKKDSLCIFPETSLRQAGSQMSKTGIKTLAVCDHEGEMIGILTVGDLARLLLEAWDKGTLPMDRSVAEVMRSENLISFQASDLLEDVKTILMETRYRNYPILDEDDKFLGLVSRHSLLSVQGKKVILVDHNERSQAVAGIEQANVIEIIDHHRIADVQTAEPIIMRNEPVGSTATIICKMYKENGIIPDIKTAGLLCSAIISDTLIFRSPTSTKADVNYAEEMAALAGIDIQSLGKEMFKAGSNIKGKNGEEILLEDFKEFTLGSYTVGVGQIEVVDMDVVNDRRYELLDAIGVLEEKLGYEIVILMITDIFKNGTELLFSPKNKRIIEKAFAGNIGEYSIFLPKVMSRKKQVIPPLSRALTF